MDDSDGTTFWGTMGFLGCASGKVEFGEGRTSWDSPETERESVLAIKSQKMSLVVKFVETVPPHVARTLLYCLFALNKIISFLFSFLCLIWHVI